MRLKLPLFLLLGILFLVFPGKVSAEVVINEFQPKPNPEWVEFFNTSGSDVNLGNYFFDDDADFNSDTGTSSKISLQGILSSGNLCYWEMSSFLNDGGDSPTLFANNGDVLDTYSYASSSASLTYSRVPDGGGWQVNTSPTKTTTSCISLPTPTVVPTPTPVPSVTSASTQAPTPTPIPTPTPTKKPTPKPTPTPESGVLGDESVSTGLDFSASQSTPAPTPTVVAESGRKFPIPAIIFILSGVSLLGFSIYSFVRGVKKGYTIKSENTPPQIP